MPPVPQPWSDSFPLIAPSFFHDPPGDAYWTVSPDVWTIRSLLSLAGKPRQPLRLSVPVLAQRDLEAADLRRMNDLQRQRHELRPPGRVALSDPT